MIFSNALPSSHHISTIFLNNMQFPLAVRHKNCCLSNGNLKYCVYKIFFQKMIEIYKDSLQYKDRVGGDREI